MICTEQEAMGKRCQESYGPPLSFGSTAVTSITSMQAVSYATGLATTTISSPAYCIGSQCMAWVWEDPLWEKPGDGTAVKTPRGRCGKCHKE